MDTQIVSEQASPVLAANYNDWIERGLVPDLLLRLGIRRLVAARLREEEAGGPEAQSRRGAEFLAELRRSPIAISTGAANAQHYEVPADFFRLVLGPRMKYSGALWREAATLTQAEEAMLELTVQRARLEDGQEILELGCGWGSLTLFMAEKFPRSQIVGVSNSRSQKTHIDAEAARRGLRNLKIVTADINNFDTDRTFHRIVSVEMFEHMRNYGELMRRIAGWSKPGGLLFVHIFAHERFAYPFEVRQASDWMAQHFFTGGIMPSENLLLHFQDHFRICEHWRVNGLHYRKTAEAWLANLDRERGNALEIFAKVYGRGEAKRWFERWRIFFMACAELFGYRGGSEWMVCHYLFQRD